MRSQRRSPSDQTVIQTLTLVNSLSRGETKFRRLAAASCGGAGRTDPRHKGPRNTRKNTKRARPTDSRGLKLVLLLFNIPWFLLFRAFRGSKRVPKKGCRPLLEDQNYMSEDRKDLLEGGMLGLYVSGFLRDQPSHFGRDQRRKAGMRCPRCHSLMHVVKTHGLLEAGPSWQVLTLRCVVCGKILDPAIRTAIVLEIQALPPQEVSAPHCRPMMRSLIKRLVLWPWAWLFWHRPSLLLKLRARLLARYQQNQRCGIDEQQKEPPRSSPLEQDAKTDNPRQKTSLHRAGAISERNFTSARISIRVVAGGVEASKGYGPSSQPGENEIVYREPACNAARV